ncbi:MAG: NTP transferase domain-containing protein [Alphaproteobacteria bacterium]
MTAPAPFTALVLAGRRTADDPVARACGVSHKVMARVAGRPMLARVLDALAASRAVGRVLVCTDDAVALAPFLPPGVETVAAAASPARSILAAADTLSEPWPLLVTTADHPLLTAEMVDHFCGGTRAADADVTAGLAPARVIRAAYPDTRRTYLRFRDDGYSGCNLFAVTRPAGLAAIRFWIRVERERKRPWRLVRAFGPVTLALFLTRRLTLEAAMRRASRVVGARAAAIVMPFAEASMDVDKPDDLAIAETVLAARADVPPAP